MNLIEEMDDIYDKFLTCRRALEIVGEVLAQNPPGDLDRYNHNMLQCLTAQNKSKAWTYYFLAQAILEKQKEANNDEC